jgi:hypothetical protein
MSNKFRRWLTLCETETLIEATEKIDVLGNEVILYRDPSASQVGSLVRRYNEIRGIEHGGTLWLWRSFYAVHFQIEAHFGFPRKECAEFSIRYYPDGGAVAEKDDYGADVWLMSRAEHLRSKLTQLMRTFPVWEFRG